MSVPASVLDVQRAASDPSVSAWVAANAGSGKTHVLAQRVIRLLLAGSRPAIERKLLDFVGNRRFGTILADPPWRFVNMTGKVAPGHRRLSRYAG